MTREEILELMRLKGWNQAQLARAMETTESAVSRWLKGESPPSGAARVLMRVWLDQARADSKKQPA